MIHLSRVEINLRRFETMKALSSPEIMHAAVMSSFPAMSGDNRPLWRIDGVGECVYIIVQSRTKPDFTHIVEQFGWPASDQKWDSLDYGPFLSRIEEGKVYRFRLRANPTKSVWNGVKGSRGKVCDHITAEQQLQWLRTKAGRCGFSISERDTTGASIVKREVLRFKSKGNSVTISVVTFEGFLKVTDREAFLKSIECGIGRAKAYGCGMLSVSML